MTNTVLIKRSGTANSIPTAGNLSAGELAINFADGNLFYKDSGNAVQLLVSNRFVSVTGNISGNNIAYGSGNVSGTGNILGSNIIATSAISAGSISLSGNVTSNLNVSGGIAAGTTIVAVGNITGGNINAGGMSLSSNVISNLSVSANIAAANVTTSGLISATGNITVGNVLTVGIISAAGNIIAGNMNGGATVTANTFNGTTFNGTTVSVTGNITAGNILGGANVNATTHTGGTVSVTGDITGGNLYTAGSISGTGNITAGNLLTGGIVSATGNVTGNYFVGNGSALTGIIASAGAAITNGTSNVTVSANSNVTVAVTGSTIATFASTGAYVTGIISATGNITGGNVSGINLGGSLTTPAQPNITSVGTLSNVSVSGNVDAGNYFTGGIVSAVGNITGGNLTGANIAGTLTTASQTNITSVGTLTALSVTGNVTSGNLTTGGDVSATGNVTAGNILGGANVNATTHTGSTVSVTGNVTGGNLVGGNISGTLITAAQTNITSVGTLTALSVTGNVSGGNLNAAGLSLSGNVVSALNSTANITTTANIASGNLITSGSGGSISGTGNITAGNLLTGGIVSAAGNVTGNYFIGNGSQLTGIAASYGNANVAANLAAFGSNPISTTGNITAGNILGGANVNATTHTGTTVSVTGNVTGNYFVGNGSQLTGIAASYGNANVAANLAAFGSNPISTSGNITTTANIASGNLITSGSGGSISGTGNITAGNLLTGGIVSATGNVTGNYFIGNGSQLTGIAASYGNANVAANLAAFGSNPISTSGNITAGNIIGTHVGNVTGTTVSVTGNVTGNYFIGNGSQLTGIAASYGNANVAANLAAFGSNPISTSGNITTTANIASGNLITTGSGGSISGTGNITAGNLFTGGLISATGNVTGNYFIGNGSQLTGIASSYGNADVAANLAAFGSNPISTSGNITAGNIIGGANVNATTHTGTTVSVTGNVTAGNLITSGFISATGNITGNNAIFTGNLSVAGNVTYIDSNVVTINDVAINLGNNAANITQVNNGGIELGPQGSPFVTFLYNSSANTFTSNVGLSAVANVTGGNLNATGLSLSGNVVSALNSTANITTTANISSGNVAVTSNATVTNTLTVFGSSSPLAAPSAVDYLVVGAGGSGFKGKTGTYWGGGGGAGQVLYGSGLAVSAGVAISVTIGAGGADQPNLDANGYSGNSSVLLGVTAVGGTGGLYNTGYGGTSGNGYTGGAPGGGATAGGGGGAGFAGSGQDGGNGITSSITGSSTYYGGGGSAGRGDSTTTGTPGLGGGGRGSNAVTYSDAVCQGAANTGGGGGGGGGGNNKGAAGGSGLVVIRYPDTYAAAQSTTGSPTYTVAGGYRIYQFTSSGTITWADANQNSTSTTTGALIVSGGVGIAKDVFTGGLISATGNVTGNYFIGNGSQLTGIASTYGNANVAANLAAFGSNPISTSGNITGGNILGGANVNATSLTGGTVSVTGDITGGNLYTAGAISSTGNSFGGNLSTTGQVISTNTGSTTTGGGQMYLNGAVNNRIDFNTNGAGAPAFTTRSTGTKIVLYPNIGVAAADYALGVESGALWSGVPDSTNSFKWYGGTTQVGSLSGTGVLSIIGNVTGANLNATGLSLSGNVVSALNSTANITTTANIAGGYILGDGSQLTGIASTYGNANVAANLAAFGSNPISTSGNITGGNIIGIVAAGANAITTTGNITGGNVNATGLSLSGNVVSALVSAADITTTANITGGYILGNGSQLTGIASTYGNANVAANLAAFGSNPISTSGNITGGNVNASGLSLSGNVVSALNSTANITTTGNITAGNILGGANVNATTHTGDTVSVTGNITGGNVITNTIVGTVTTIKSTGALNLSATGNIEVNSTYISNLLDPVQNQDAATKYYVDSVAQGLHIHDSADLASTADLATYTGATVTYNNGASGVGATLSLVGNTLTTLDGVSIPAPISTRLLIKNQANAVQNGMYNYTSSSLLTRSTDFDTSSEAAGGDFLFVTSGATLADTGWVQTTDNPTLGTSPIVFTQFSGAGTFTANTAAGLVLNGTVFSAKTDNISTTFDGTGNIVVKAGAQLTTPNIGAATGTSLSVTGNITGGNIVGLVDAGSNVIITTGNITGGNILGSANVNATTHTGATVSVTGNIITGGGVVSRVVSIADAVSVTINADTTDLATQTNTQVAGTLTVNAPTGTLANGQKIMFRLQSSNVQTFSWNAVFVGSTDLSLPTTSSGSSKYDYTGFIYNSTATKWQLLAKNFGF